MAWIEVHQSLWSHRKTLAVADALNLPELYAASHLIALWTWAMDNAPDGTFPVTVTSRIIARGSQWTGDPDMYVHALVDAGFLDYDQSGHLVIHDWDQYGGKLNTQRQANAERQKRHRDRQKTESVTSQDDVTPSEPPVTVTSPLRNAPEKSTEEKSTEEDTGEAPLTPPTPMRKPRAQRKSADMPIPDDFTLTPERVAYAAKNGMSETDARFEFEQLRNWAESKGAKKTSWDATWRTWVMRRKKERDEARAVTGRQFTVNGRASPYEKTRAAFAEVNAALDDWIASNPDATAIDTTGRRHA